MVDKDFCMSSFLAFRYIEADDKEFYEDMHHQKIKMPQDAERIPVHNAKEIDEAITKEFAKLRGKKLGVLLSGGMDSAVCASYMTGCDAYTFRFLGGRFDGEELKRAEYYAKYYGLRLHYVDIDWCTVERYVNQLMEAKGAPVHSIEPQVLQAALQAKDDGIEMMVIGDGSDYVFYGMDKLISQDWDYEGFKERYLFMNPADALIHPVDMDYLFARYRQGEDGIDYLKFMDDIATEESYGSYQNAFQVAGMSFFDPYERLIMVEPLDLERVRRGESKYWIRELMAHKYPEIPVPVKKPMPRPVDTYFENWAGPKRPEFKTNLDMSKFTGNQKWQLWCLERFLNINEKR